MSVCEDLMVLNGIVEKKKVLQRTFPLTPIPRGAEVLHCRIVLYLRKNRPKSSLSRNIFQLLRDLYRFPLLGKLISGIKNDKTINLLSIKINVKIFWW